MTRRKAQNRDERDAVFSVEGKATHNTDLLDLNQIRRDQIWFTEINPNGRQIDFYSLSEIKNVRKDENIKKGYISGKYGAIPMPNSEIQRICEE